VVKRRHGLDRCRYKGFVGMNRWVGLGVIADNVINLGRAKKNGRPANKARSYNHAPPVRVPAGCVLPRSIRHNAASVNLRRKVAMATAAKLGRRLRWRQNGRCAARSPLTALFRIVSQKQQAGRLHP
jgi:hypothetical protein